MEDRFKEYAHKDTWEGLAERHEIRKVNKRHSAPVLPSERSFYSSGVGFLGLDEDEKTRDGARISVNQRRSLEFKPSKPATFGTRGKHGAII